MSYAAGLLRLAAQLPEVADRLVADVGVFRELMQRLKTLVQASINIESLLVPSSSSEAPAPAESSSSSANESASIAIECVAGNYRYVPDLRSTSANYRELVNLFFLCLTLLVLYH